MQLILNLNIPNNFCSICMTIVKDDVILKTECGHYYHKECLNKWTKNNNSCPECRNNFSSPSTQKLFSNLDLYISIKRDENLNTIIKHTLNTYVYKPPDKIYYKIIELLKILNNIK